MFRLLKSSFFKLIKDWTLRITLIIGLALAVFLTILYGMMDASFADGYHSSLCGQSSLINSFSPSQNFGIAIPINLAIFTILEFSQGTIRNKIVVGNSKLKVYISLLITGLLFTFALLIIYVGFSTILGTIFGKGFFPNYSGEEQYIKEMIKSQTLDSATLVRFVIIGLLSYVTITSFAVFIGTLLRNIGPSIPLIIVPLVLLSLIPMFIYPFALSYYSCLESANEALEIGNNEMYNYYMEMANSYESYVGIDNALQIFDPFYIYGMIINTTFGEHIQISSSLFTKQVLSNICYSGLFSFFGALIFTHRDLK